MPRSSGTYTPPVGQPVVSGTVISSTTFNTLVADLGNELTNSLPRDGSAPPTANTPMGNFKITGLGAATLATDAPQYQQFQSGAATYLTSVAGTNTITASLTTPVLAAYAEGNVFRFISAGANTGPVTLNINSLGAKAITKTGAAALVAGDISASAVYEIVYDGTQFQIVGAVNIPANTVTALSLANSAIANTSILNGYVDFTTSGNALTAAIKTFAGTDPSATDPVYVVFLNAALGTAGYVVRAITSALSVVASSGSTLGTVSNQASRIRAVAVDNAGTVVLGLYNSFDNTNTSLLGIDESAVYSTTAEGGAGAADSAQIIYTTAAQTSKAVRELGYVESIQTTAGTWAQALDKKVTAGVGYRRTGDVVRKIQQTKTDTTSIATTTLTDITGLSITTALMSACNLVHLNATLQTGSSSGTNNAYLLALRGATPIIQGDAAGSRTRISAAASAGSAAAFCPLAMDYTYKPNDASSAAYKLQWAASSGTVYLNRSSTDTDSALYGRASSSLLLEEIFA